jgi:hypothetical protein
MIPPDAGHSFLLSHGGVFGWSGCDMKEIDERVSLSQIISVRNSGVCVSERMKPSMFEGILGDPPGIATLRSTGHGRDCGMNHEL